MEDRRYVVCLNEDEARKDRADREAIVAAAPEPTRPSGRQVSGRQPGLSQVSQDRPPRCLHHRRRAGPPGRALRRQVGAADEHRAAHRRGGAEVQAAMDGRGPLPVAQVPARDTADLPQVRRHNPRTRLLLLPGSACSAASSRSGSGSDRSPRRSSGPRPSRTSSASSRSRSDIAARPSCCGPSFRATPERSSEPWG